MLFSKDVWSSIHDIYEHTLNHDFLKELSAGTLPLDKFAYYIGQDMLYLAEYSKILSFAAIKSETDADRTLFLNAALNASAVETDLHRYYINKYDFIMPKVMTPSCFAYSHYLVSIASQMSLGVTVAALFPCAIIYAEIGLKLSKTMVEDNRYARWIKEYANPEFMKLAIQIRDVADRVAENANAQELAQMKASFIMSARLEYHFWNDAYELKTWGV